MGILFTILMGILFTITIGILFTIVLGIQFTISKDINIDYILCVGKRLGKHVMVLSSLLEDKYIR